MYDWGNQGLIPGRGRDIPLNHIYTGSVTCSRLYPVGTNGFTGDQATGT